MLLAMGKVMLEMIAVVLEEVVVFVLDFPAGAARGDHLDNIVFIDGV
jgi:hypothetical protein